MDEEKKLPRIGKINKYAYGDLDEHISKTVQRTRYTNRLADKSAVRARMALICWDKLHGMPMKKMVEKYGVSEKTINEALNTASKQNFFKNIETHVVETLATKALKLYEKALDEEDLFVAKDVLNQVHKFAERNEKKEANREGMTLAMWLQLRKEAQSEGLSASETPEVIDAQFKRVTEITGREYPTSSESDED